MDEEHKISGIPSLSVVIPCYNEEENIHRIATELVPELEKLGAEYEILVIDDGSTDKTYETAMALNLPQLRVIRHEKNKNIGAALKTGFQEAKGQVCMPYDGDFTYPVGYIKVLADRFFQNDVDFVSGSPELADFGKEIPFYRQAISRLANFIYSFLLGKKVTAVTHTFRIYKTSQIKELNLETNGFDIGAEMLFRLIQNKRSFVEVPVCITQRLFGESKLDYKKEIINHFRLLKKIIKWRFKI